MLRVVIADDERIQREGITRHIPWNELNMELVGCAEDGIEALELIEIYQAEILITDIKMTKMNGLELSRKAKDLNPQLKIIIISGYDEFEFARSAIELNAYSFILKPISIQYLKDKLEKIGSQIRMEQKSESDMLLMKKQLEESKPLFVDKFLKDLLYGFLKNEDIIRKRAEFLSLTPFENGYNILLIQADHLVEENHSEADNHLFYLSCYNYLVEAYTNTEKGKVILSKENEFILILHQFNQDEPQRLQQIEDLRNNLQGLFNKTITIGVSRKKNKLVELHESYKEAEAASRQKFYLGKGNTICYQDINLYTSSYLSLEEKVERLIADVGIGKYQEIEEAIVDILKLFTAPSGIREHDLKAFCLRIMSDIFRIVYDSNEKVETIFGNDEKLWRDIYRFDTIPDVRQWLIEKLTAIAKYIYHKRSRKNSSVIQTIVDVLEHNYNEQITIEDLAKKVFLTPNYICNIFRENVGESIIDYLTKVRMRNAKSLLAETDAKIYEVAEKTGFNSTSYFSVVFKNMFGVSPKEFRGKSG